jgi:hypothetical protein
MEFFDMLDKLKGADGAVLIAMSLYIVKLLNNHLVHSFGKIEEQLTKLDDKIDKLPCKNGDCK